ncbi:hypothetical protein [Roseibium sp.]|uniref:hypothetical protein n=1 Tax=Roseibium sp. TaxID=1936156 RepID=UPI003A9731A2
MPDRTTSNAARRRARETLTNQRLTVLGWAFTAILCGVAGLAALQYGQPLADRLAANYDGVQLPAVGPVSSTASIGLNGQDISLGIYDMPSAASEARNLISSGHIETLQKEVVSLRRHVFLLSEQNAQYSRRLAALEEKLQAGIPESPAQAGTTQAAPDKDENAANKTPVPSPAKQTPAAQTQATEPADPRAAALKAQERFRPTVDTKSSQDTQDDSDSVRSRIEFMPAPETRSGKPFLTLSQLPRGTNSGDPAPAPRPVRIVQLPPAEAPSYEQAQLLLPPEDGLEPTSTASIPSATRAAIPRAALDASQTRQQVAPAPEVDLIIKPSKASGQSQGGSGSVSRSDFAVVLGHFESDVAAAEAWEKFTTDNSERIADLKARSAPSALHPGEIDLLVGPFANAADATVACLRLIDSAGQCHPTLFSGDALPALPSMPQGRS